MPCLEKILLTLPLLLMVDLGCAAQKEVEDLDIEALMDVQVTSVSKKAQTLSEAAAAIYVLNQEDIKRSGVTTVPDALRMVPGLDVGRIDANKWAVSARGFNGRFTNKLLVLIDGRSIYTQSFSGVYWENQDVLLEDIERIEVIRGPGAALWGANAVNGVINIITKHSTDTQGGTLTAGGGNLEQGFGSFRYGKTLGADTTGKVYVKGFQREAFNLADKTSARDDWNKVQGGFRVDSLLNPQDTLMVSGDLYQSNINQIAILPSLNSPSYQQSTYDTTHAAGGNINSRFEHAFSLTSNYTVQLYYDIYKRNETIANETRQTFNLDAQHHFALNDWNDIVWGMGYRFLSADFQFPHPEIFSTVSNNRDDHYYNAFVQDELTLIDEHLWLTLGNRLEHNDYTGFEVQPSARLSWAPHRHHRFWGGVSRAVRTPSVIEAEGQMLARYIPPNSGQNPLPLPIGLVVTGNSNIRAEELLAYEVGYRVTLNKNLSIDSTAFYNDYQSMRSTSLGPLSFNGTYLSQAMLLSNAGSRETYGFETALVLQMLDWWRWDLNYSYLGMSLQPNQFFKEAASPSHKSSLRAVISPMQDITTDFWLRYVDNSSVFTLNGPVEVGGYVTLDLRVAWKPLQQIELSITGQNLFDGQHLESVQETYAQSIEIPRSVFGKVAWSF